jgi:hypothetical protein
MRRRWFPVIAVAALTACAAGCSAAGPSPWPTAQKGPVTITILSGTDSSISPGSSPLPGATGMYSELIDWWNAYEKPITGIRVQMDTIDGGATLEHSEMLAAAQADDAGYDIYNLDNEWVSEFAAGNYIRVPGRRKTRRGRPPAVRQHDGQATEHRQRNPGGPRPGVSSPGLAVLRRVQQHHPRPCLTAA